MQDRFTEELALRDEDATIAMVDVVESVRLVAENERAAVERIRHLLARLARECVPAHAGRVVERQGDGLLLRFDHPRQAVACAAAMQRLALAQVEPPASAQLLPPASLSSPPPSPVLLRVGLHRARLLTDDAALYGQGVNLAARIAAQARPGEVLLSAEVRDQLHPGLDPDVEDLGECHLKHVEQPVRLFRLADGAVALPESLRRAITARMKLRPTLVVLPAELGRPGTNLHPIHPGPLGWADVLTDQLSKGFCRSPMLHVISSLSARALKCRSFEPALLYRHWNADYLLQTTLLGAAQDDTPGHSRVQLHLALWRAGVGEPVQEITVQGRLDELLTAQSDLLLAAHSFCARVLAIEQRAARVASQLPNLSSHTLYLNAVDLLHRYSVADFDRARQMLLALTERAPRQAEPLAWLARWHVFRVFLGWTDNQQRDSALALEFSQRALDQDAESSLALTMAGSVRDGIAKDPVGAQNYYAQALQHNPNEPLAWLMSGVAQGFLANTDSSLAASETALGLAPVDPMRHFYDSLAASASVMSGDYERGIALAERALRENTRHGSTYRALATAQAMLGRMDEARLSIDRLLAIEPHTTVQTYLARLGTHNQNTLRFAEALQAAGLPTH